MNQIIMKELRNNLMDIYNLSTNNNTPDDKKLNIMEMKLLALANKVKKFKLPQLGNYPIIN